MIKKPSINTQILITFTQFPSNKCKIFFPQITCSVIGLKWIVLRVLLFFTIDEGISNTSETDVLNFHTKLISLGMPSTSHCIWAVSPRPTLYVWTCPGRQSGATVHFNVWVCMEMWNMKRQKTISSQIKRKLFGNFHKFCLHWISNSAWLLSPSPSALLAMHVYWPICDLRTFVITKLWFEIIIPSLNVFDKSLPCVVMKSY